MTMAQTSVTPNKRYLKPRKFHATLTRDSRENEFSEVYIPADRHLQQKMLFEQLVCELREGSIGEGEKAGVIYQHQRSEMAARKGLSQEKNPSWYFTHFIGAKTKLEN